MEMTQFLFFIMSIILGTLCASMAYCVVMDVVQGNKFDSNMFAYLVFMTGVTGMFVWLTTVVRMVS